MPLEMSLGAQQQPPVCILITHLHNIQAFGKDYVFIINIKIRTSNVTLYMLQCRTDCKSLLCHLQCCGLNTQYAFVLGAVMKY